MSSKACCTVPPAKADYDPRGGYKNNLYNTFDKIYVTGDSRETALIIVYDIFGFAPQTLQGADLLAGGVCAKVFIPDFFGGKPFPIEKFPPKDDQAKKELEDFFNGIANPPANADRLAQFVKELKGEGYKSIGALGFCWGGKVVILGAESSPLTAISIVHPARLAAQDAEKLTIPLGLYVSKDESKEEFDKIVQLLSEKPFAEKVDSKYYSNMFHGWAAARGNLSDLENRREYDDLYERAAAFFTKAFA